MQLGAKETENERFAHYLTKTYRKTASLIANGLKAVSHLVHYHHPQLICKTHASFCPPQEAMLAGADSKLSEIAFEYGRNVGIAFQLVDDLLDFVSSTDAMGKPTAADLKLGLATAPVLFACEKVKYLRIVVNFFPDFFFFRYVVHLHIFFITGLFSLNRKKKINYSSYRFVSTF